MKTSDAGRNEAAIRDIAMLSDTPERSSLQFSFATKLLNTIDSREPVYDTHVTSFYFFVPPASDRPFEARLDALLEFYEFLRGEYARVIGQGLLRPAIDQFRERVSADPDLCDERIVDLLIWGFVSLMRRGVQQSGECCTASEFSISSVSRMYFGTRPCSRYRRCRSGASDPNRLIRLRHPACRQSQRIVQMSSSPIVVE